MYKRIIGALLCLALMLSCAPAMAEIKAGRNVQLVVCNELLTLNDDTGFISKDDESTYIPIAAVAQALGYEFTFNAKKTGIAVKTADGDIVKAVKGYRTVTVNGEKHTLTQPPVMAGGALLAPLEILAYLKADSAAYPHDARLQRLGYSGPTLVISHAGQSTLPPEIGRASFAADLEAAKATDQIIAVQYSGDGKAELSYHEKIGGQWRQLLSAEAFVGKNGIGKSVDGDKKTPRGTYDLTFAFGIRENPGTALPYTQLTRSHVWCCSEQSEYYNRLIDTEVTGYEPAEADLTVFCAQGYCDYAIAIDYNADCVPGKGSGVFLHCAGSAAPTNGSIAVDAGVLSRLLMLIRPGAKIVIF